MSYEIKIDFEVRNMAIMADTLNEMRVKFKESKKNNTFTIKRSYKDIVINGNTNKISCDHMSRGEVDIITQNYMVNWYKDKAIREGNEIREEITANGEVHLHVIR